MSRFSASKAAPFLEASFPFFLGEFFNLDCIDIHGIWVNFQCWLSLSVGLLCGIRGVDYSLSDGVGLFPLCFEIDGPCVPVINFCGNHIHSIDSFHKGRWKPSGKEIDQGVFVGDFADGDLVFELRNIISKW